MSIPVDSNVRQGEVFSRDTSLLKELDGAPVVGHMVARLGRQHYRRDVRQVNKLARAVRGLNDAIRDTRSVIAGDDLLDEVGGGVGDGRVVGQRRIRETVGAGRGGREDSLAEGRAGRLDGDDALDEGRAGVGQQPRHQAALAVGDEHGRLADAVEQLRAGVLEGRLLIDGGAAEERHGGGVVGVEVVVTHGAVAGPLRVELRLRPQVVLLDRGEALLEQLGRIGAGGQAGRGRRTAAVGLINDVDLVALAEKVR